MILHFMNLPFLYKQEIVNAEKKFLLQIAANTTEHKTLVLSHQITTRDQQI